MPHEHVVPPGRLGLDEPDHVHPRDRADPRLEGRRLLRPRPLPPALPRHAVAGAGPGGTTVDTRRRPWLTLPPRSRTTRAPARVVPCPVAAVATIPGHGGASLGLRH